MRISTQVYVPVDGQRKQLEFTGPDGVTRVMTVDVDLDVCHECGAVFGSASLHAKWHAAQRQLCDS